jgi:hypothetical protein
VLSIEVKGDAGGRGGGGSDDDGEASGSDGGQGGRGARRRPRLDARLIEEDKLDFPMVGLHKFLFVLIYLRVFHPLNLHPPLLEVFWR